METPEKQPRPSEKFLLIHRLFTFFDEWMFYGLLLILFLGMNPTPEDYAAVFKITACLGALFIVVSYAKQWYMEAQRFESQNRE